MMDYKEQIVMHGQVWYLKAIMEGTTSKALQAQFLQTMYHTYNNMRFAVGGNKCYKMALAEVKEHYKNESTRINVMRDLQLTDENIELVLHIAETRLQKLVR